ncbi:MAG TPA: hypothetical protein ENI23_14340, partial [bacterium]|nr:hypothetical protein [bacterium]
MKKFIRDLRFFFSGLLVGILVFSVIGGLVWAAAVFPGALDNFSTGDVLEAEDVDAIQEKIGIDNSTDTDSIDYIIKNTAGPLGKIRSLETTTDYMIISDGNNWATTSSSSLPYWDELSDMTLAAGNIYMGDSSGNPIATTSLYIEADGGVTFSKNATGVDPVADKHLVTLSFMEDAIPGILDFYLASSTDGNTGFFDLFPDDLGTGETSFASSTAANTDDQLIATWISTSTLPNTLEQGKVVEMHIHAEETGANANTRLYFTLATTSGPVFLTSEISGIITSKDSVRMHKPVTSDIEFVLGDRLELALFANVGSGAPGEITIYFEGRTASRLEIPAPTSVLISGLLKASGAKPLTGNWGVDGFNITNIGEMTIGTTTDSGILTVGTSTPLFVIDDAGNVGIG